MRRRLVTILFVSLALALGFTPLARGACIKRHEVRIASGLSPSGSPWSVEGTIGNNGEGCRDWLFGMDFDIEGGTNWGWGTGIPAGGHLKRYFEIDSYDDLLEDGSYRVFSGATGGEVAKVLITLSNNQHIAIRPRSPSKRLRHKVIWLRNVRYFVEYYPPVGYVTGVATFDEAGVMLYRDKTYEGF